MNLRGILDGKQTLCYKFISDILISMFSGINKCSQGRNIFVIDFGSSQYQNFVISLICVSAEFPAYNALGFWLFSYPLACSSFDPLVKALLLVYSSLSSSFVVIHRHHRYRSSLSSFIVHHHRHRHSSLFIIVHHHHSSSLSSWLSSSL